MTFSKSSLAGICRSVLFFLILVGLLSQNGICQSPEELEAIKLKRARNERLNSILNDKTKEINHILPEINKTIEAAKKDSYLCLKEVVFIVSQLQNRATDEKATALAKELIEEFAFTEFRDDDIAVPGEGVLCKEMQLHLLLMPQYRPQKSEIIVDCRPAIRKKHAWRVLELYQGIVGLIGDEYDPNAFENMVVMNGFIPPASFDEPYNSGQDMSKAKDPATREAYKKYLKECDLKFDKRAAYDVRQRWKEEVQKYLIDAYSLFPYRTEELKKMLTEHKVDPATAQTILDAVRKNEVEHPDFGGRRWLSTDKLFQADAKFISVTNGVVTLEKADGKRTTIELDALRQEDREYVKEQAKGTREKQK